MRLIAHCAHAAAILALTAAFASPAEAQTIRTYGDTQPSGNSGGQSSSGSSAQGWYPGMPVPQQDSGGQQQQQPAGQQQKQAGAQESEGESKIGPSHRITIFSGKTGGADQPRTTLDLAVDQLYRGVIPGTRDSVSHLARAAKKGAKAGTPNRLTWVGFRPADEYTRVFFQTAREPDYTIRRSQDPALIEIKVENTKIAARNFSRFIDTSYFNRNVELIEADQVDRDTVKIVIKLETFEQPTVRNDGQFVYFDFPHDSPAKQAGEDAVADQADDQQ